MTEKRRKPLFERLREGLEEGIAYADGKLTLNTVEIPDDPPEIDAETMIALRTRAEMSQAVFAKMLSVSTKTLQSWEQGKRQPSDASRRLIQIFSSHPEMICRSVGLPVVGLEGVEIKTNSKGRSRIVVRKVQKKRKRTVSAQ